MRHVRIRTGPKSALLVDMMTNDVMDGLETGVRPPDQKDRLAKDKAAEKIYRDDKGRMGLPTEMVIGALKVAGCHVKNGKKTISQAGGKKTTLFEFMVFEKEFFVFSNVDKAGNVPWVVDRRKGIGYQAKTPTAVCIIRAKISEWPLEIEFQYNEKYIKSGTVRQLWENALSAQGLGSFRPNHGGPFGRSLIVAWEEKAIGDDGEVEQLDDAELQEKDGELVGAGVNRLDR